jgi:signal transduction histidine kinase
MTMNATDHPGEHALAVFAHELRAPLASILYAAQALDTSGDDNSATSELRAIVERQSRYAATLIENVLEACWVASGKARLREDPFDVRLVAKRAVETVGPLLTERGHRLTLSLPGEAMNMVADALRVQQIIVNLLSNAAKYTAVGGRIGLAVEAAGSFVRIEVSDNGVGISPVLLPYVFDFYRQGESAPGPAFAGLGVGLALVKSLVELHGGSVHAYSDGVGNGSTFVVWLPVAGGASRQTSLCAPSIPGAWRMSDHPASGAMVDA